MTFELLTETSGFEHDPVSAYVHIIPLCDSDRSTIVFNADRREIHLIASKPSGDGRRTQFFRIRRPFTGISCFDLPGGSLHRPLTSRRPSSNRSQVLPVGGGGNLRLILIPVLISGIAFLIANRMATLTERVDPEQIVSLILRRAAARPQTFQPSRGFP